MICKAVENGRTIIGATGDPWTCGYNAQRLSSIMILFNALRRNCFKQVQQQANSTPDKNSLLLSTLSSLFSSLAQRIWELQRSPSQEPGDMDPIF